MPEPNNLSIQTSLLVVRTQVGDMQAFSELHALYAAHTLKYLKAIVGDTIANDVNQETWIGVYNRVSSVVNPKSFRSWLFRMARNKALDVLRASTTRSQFLVETSSVADLPLATQAVEYELPSSPSDFDKHLEALSEQHREVVILKYWEGMSYAEIAIIIGVPVGTIRSRLFHAKSILKDRLSKSEHYN